MIYLVFLLVLAEIMVNWLYKSKDLKRNVIMNALYALILISSIVGLCLKPDKVFLYVYYGVLIASNTTKLLVSEFVEKLIEKKETIK